MKRIANDHMIAEHFSSLNEFVEVVSKREPNPSIGKVREITGDKRWRGEDNIQDAWKHLSFGDKSLLKDIKLELNKTTGTKPARRRQQFNDVVGYAPNVPNLLMGRPKTMLNSRRVHVKTKVVTLLCDVSVNCGIDKKRVVEYGSNVVKAIQQLEQNGYRVELIVMATFAHDYGHEKKHFVCIPIKPAGQPLDLMRVAYPLTSVAMLRYIFFDWYESCPEAEYVGGYGSSLYIWSKADREKFLQEAYPNRQKMIYVKFGDDVVKTIENAEIKF